MITVPEVSKKIIYDSPYLRETFEKGLMNLSALSRYIKPRIEKELKKSVSEPAILMACKRLMQEQKTKPDKTFKFFSKPDMIVRSNLIELNIANSETLTKKHQFLVNSHGVHPQYFFVLTQGIFETTIILSQELEKTIIKALSGEKIVSEYQSLSSITIRLPKNAIDTPGTYYRFIKELAWEGINVIEIVSAYLELTIIVKDNEVNRTFGILKALCEKID